MPAIIYAVAPRDLIPDVILVIGFLDDMLIIPGLILFALKLTMKDIVDECRVRAYNE